MKKIKLLLPAALPLLLLSACSHLGTQENTLSSSTPSSPSFAINENIAADDALLTSTYEDIWSRILTNYQLDTDSSNARIDAHLTWFKRNQSYLDRVAERGVRYLHYITEQIEVRGVPGELALLPVVESAFDPFAYSHGRASGVWQFIPSTGQIFGLQQDWWHDGRRDIRASTEAALTFLEALNREFNGDWLLALAAYNSGAGTVRRAIRINRNQGKPTDFWSLDLPKETRDYVPKLLALAKVIKEPEAHNMTLVSIPDEPYFAVANTGGQIDLSLVAELSATDIDEIYKLNPSFNRWATRPNGPHEVLIPASQLDLFNEQIAQLSSKDRTKWQRYVVKNGDTLISIAKHFHTTPEVLISTNNIRGNMIRVNQQLLIPSAFLTAEHYSHSEHQRLNRLVNLRQPANTQRIDYSVRNGDTLWGIAMSHNITVSNLARWNGMAPKDPIRAGQTLVIWSNTPSAPMAREIIRKISYRVRAGDSLAGISQRFNVNLADIKRWNSSQANKKYIQPGQMLTLYVDVTR